MAKLNSFQLQYSDFAAKHGVVSKKHCTRCGQRPAACTSSPLSEKEAVQSANLCFQCTKLQWHTLHIGYLYCLPGEKTQESCPPLAPETAVALTANRSNASRNRRLTHCASCTSVVAVKSTRRLQQYEIAS